MNGDLTRFLQEWPYDPEQNIRLVDAEGGHQVLQVRQPLGIEQYELDGRPDGARPNGHDTMVDAVRTRLAEHVDAQGSETGFTLTHTECAAMQNEGVLFYYRYLMLYQLNDFDRVVRDTSHNLAICDLLQQFCDSDSDRVAVLQYKPYIYRMHAAAQAMRHIQLNDRAQARMTLKAAIGVIQAMKEVDTPAFQFERVRSVNYLRSTLDKIDTEHDDPVDELASELADAVAREDYERAAELRDHIRGLT